MKKLSQNHLADLIISSRKSKSITQAQLSEITGVNRAMLSRIESGDYIPSIPQLISIANALEFDPSEVFVTADETAPKKRPGRKPRTSKEEK